MGVGKGIAAQRQSNKAIAGRLGMRPRTASTHLSNIYHKLGLSSRGELADAMRGHDMARAFPRPAR